MTTRFALSTLLFIGAALKPLRAPEPDVEALKNAQISAAIASRVAAGAAVSEAIDAVLGVGAYAKLAGDLHDALRAKAARPA